MTHIVKRLEIIKSSIAIEDEELVALQIEKLQMLEIDDAVKKIVMLLQKALFTEALLRIEAYLSQHNSLVLHVDKELQALKMELKVLENDLQKCIEQKIEYLNEIETFNRVYNFHLGELIKIILNLKKEILYKKTIKKQNDKEKYHKDFETYEDTQNDIDELKETLAQLEEALEEMDEDNEHYDEISKAYQELQEELDKLEEELSTQKEALDEMKTSFEEDSIETEYEEMKSAYEDFENEYEHIKEEFESKLSITEEDKQELKKLYKKAARLCHPDIVVDELKDKAHALMQQLNDAYSKMDLVAIKEMLKSLENGISFLVASDSINDKELLKAKIDELEEKIQAIKEEIEQIQSDETYQVIQKLDDWDGYFEELKTNLEEEKERLEKEARVVFEETSDRHREDISGWAQKLWEWADYYNIPNGKLSRKQENLLSLSKIDFTGIKLTFLPKEIALLKNLKELILWDCDLLYLPKTIMRLTDLRKLNIRGNPRLAITNEQKIWLGNLAKSADIYKDTIGFLEDEALDSLEKSYEALKNSTHFEIQDEYINMEILEKEESPYARHIKSIENPSFEKIRRYCNNLVDDHKADNMQEYLARNGKMKKALIYDALEQFIENLNGEAITLIDWGCGQGIGAMLVLDFIKEKQLDITVEKIFLLDEISDIKILNRAFDNAASLKQLNTNIYTSSLITCDPDNLILASNNNVLNILNNCKNDNLLHLFVNDVIPFDLFTFDSEFDDDILTGYFLCVSNNTIETINYLVQQIRSIGDIDNITERVGKIGRFERYERIFKVFKSIININEDEIPF